jgi:hypothetical protein
MSRLSRRCGSLDLSHPYGPSWPVKGIALLLLLLLLTFIPVTGREGQQRCETLRLPHFLDNRLTDGGEADSLTRQPPFTPREDSWYSFLLEAEFDRRDIVRLEGLGKLKKQLPHRESNPRPSGSTNYATACPGHLQM